VAIHRGSRVSWRWGGGKGAGTVQEIHRERVTRTIKGEEITRNGTEENPAYLIDSDGGAQVLKLRSELEED
jgi:hypothetical protein